MATIYDRNIWTTITFYPINFFILVGSYFYYSTQNHTSGASFATDLAAGKWNGIANDGLDTKSFFFWRPSYDYSVPVQPRIKTTVFGDGYQQVVKDGLNNILLSYDFTFDKRDLAETTAILHFFNTRGGWESFLFMPPDPMTVMKRFRCNQWSHKQTFYNNYTISANFEESIV